MRYAIVSNGVVINVAEHDPTSPPANAIPSDTANLGDAWNGTIFVPPAVSATPDYPMLAQAALDRSDMVALRCLKAAVAFPPEWQAYVTALRAIVAATTPGPLPTRPAYPAGT